MIPLNSQFVGGREKLEERGGYDQDAVIVKVPFHISFSVAEIVIYMQGLLETAPCKVV